MHIEQALIDLGCETAIVDGRRIKVVMPTGVTVRELYAAAVARADRIPDRRHVEAEVTAELTLNDAVAIHRTRAMQEQHPRVWTLAGRHQERALELQVTGIEQ